MNLEEMAHQEDLALGRSHSTGGSMKAPWTEGNMTKYPVERDIIVSDEQPALIHPRPKKTGMRIDLRKNEVVLMAWALIATILGGIITSLI